MPTHKLSNDTVEDESIIIPILNVRDKILHCFGCDVRVKLEEDVSLIGMYRSGSSGSSGFLDNLNSCTLLFACGSLVEDISVASFLLTVENASVCAPSRKGL